ncbi:TIGR02530 family flagellar biosynthesis protein [Gorillibacterium timonense]|uniref:TIGR02530 family flagellar biosynthesis protein n=1 Tax=Gorillibacterium timonense TaxID=1689269 RepID=UPI00071CCBF3|nr:TIGR02530 family flagellar biosynthesis protein [Gorillibacterium timonense]
MNEPVSVGRLYPSPVPPGVTKRSNAAVETAKPAVRFQDMLQQEVRISKHAQNRLQERGINLKPEQMEQIRTAVDKAEAKGAKESLVLMRDMAFIVNVKSKTIVTAMDGSSMKDNVFTQIDSAIVI